MGILKLTNPHSVTAALQTRPQDVLEVHASERRSNESWKEVITQAHAHGITVQEPLSMAAGGRKQNREGGRIGTTYAMVRDRPGVSLEELFAPTPSRGLWLALDQLQDPHNVGAIFRTAAFFGVQGVVLTIDRSAPLSPTVYDVASGGLEYVPFTLQTNLARALDLAKEQGLWVLGSSEHAESDLSEIDPDRRWLLVLGNEEKGLRRLTRERCDHLCRISPLGPVPSLNVSVAAAVLVSRLTQPVK